MIFGVPGEQQQCATCVRAIMSLVILFLTNGWSVSLIKYIGRQRVRKSGVLLEGSTTFFDRVWR